ncbi:hypothetical protein [Paraburkholderia aromaticivorans]|uniref:hypothetical protein n=1 Tax=Paraburkholderia aromaticivorans TaxID=2026199 RepID=UPI0012FDCFB1|nr:hypothetical protein [Paraburkholderia aromaticivorans]
MDTVITFSAQQPRQLRFDHRQHKNRVQCGLTRRKLRAGQHVCCDAAAVAGVMRAPDSSFRFRSPGVCVVFWRGVRMKAAPPFTARKKTARLRLNQSRGFVSAT